MGIGSFIGSALSASGVAGGGGAGLGAGLASSALGLYQQNREFNFTREQTAFQAAREDNAIQRKYADMEKAGINPILAASGGPPAASAAGTQMGHSNVRLQDAVNTGVSAAKTSAEIAKIDTEIDNLLAQYHLTWEQSERVKQEAKRIINESNLLFENATIKSMERMTLEDYYNFLMENGELQKLRALFDKLGIESRDITNMIGDVLKIIFGKIKSVTGINSKPDFTRSLKK